MPSVELDPVTIHYETFGPEDGRPVVFVHGYWMGGEVWQQVSERLARAGLRCFTPTWPMGGHTAPVRPGADQSIYGVAATVAQFLDRLELQDAVIVGNDSGGVVSQLVAVHHRDRVGALVLTSCDAFEHFPPPILDPVISAARSKLLFCAAVQTMRLPIMRQRAYGDLAHSDITSLARKWVQPALGNRAIAEDLRRLTLSFHADVTTGVAAKLPEFDKPALIAWSGDDVFFGVEDGKRLADTIPHAQLEVIDQARTFSMVDQPDRLAQLLATFTARS